MNTQYQRIIIDTNVVSELYKPHPNPTVVQWLRANNRTYLTSITIMELMYGMWRMPKGKRRNAVSAAIEATLEQYDGRILPFDTKASIQCSLIRADLDGKGLHVSLPNTQIAAIAHSNACAVATRNTKDFAYAEVPLINPWKQ